LALAALLLGSAAVRADDQDVIDYRVHVMKSMAEELGAINMVLAKKGPADNLVAHAQALAVTAPQARKAFEPKVAGGKSKPEVWSNWADFAKQLDALVSQTDELAKAAKDGGAAAVASKIQSLNCKSCHDTYMVAAKS
jgi:cytochrome c556